MKNTNRETAITAILDYFNNNEEVFNSCIEELDAYNGYLGDDRYYPMYEINEFYNGADTLEILQRAYFGYDEDTSTETSRTKFNPNRDYFKYNGYGNLVSTDYIDYSALLDHWAVESMAENRNDIYTISDYDELKELFDALEKCDTEE